MVFMRKRGVRALYQKLKNYLVVSKGEILWSPRLPEGGRRLSFREFLYHYQDTHKDLIAWK